MKMKIKHLEVDKTELQKYSDTVKKYPNNSEIKNIVEQKSKLLAQLRELSNQKMIAMQQEDENAQYNIEQKENETMAKLKELEISQAKAQAKAEGRTRRSRS